MEYESYRIGNSSIFVTGIPCKPKEKRLLLKMLLSIGLHDPLTKVNEIRDPKFIIVLGDNYYNYEGYVPIKLVNHPSYILKDYITRILKYWEHWLYVRKTIEEHNLV